MAAVASPDHPNEPGVEGAVLRLLETPLRRVLVVEDDPSLAALLVEVMRDHGFDPVACATGEIAWARIRQQHFPLLVLDWLLPGTVDGLDLCRRLRRQDGGDRPYAIVLTGRTGPTDLDAVLAAGADDYLAKPFDLDDLRVRLAIAAKHVRARTGRARRARGRVAPE